MGRRSRDKSARRREAKSAQLPEGERLARLVGELTADPEMAEGRRRFPRQISDEDALAITAALHGELDEGVVAREEDARSRGARIACERGCTGCCEEMVLVSRPEALAAARFLSREENADARRWFRANFRRWRESVSDDPERLADLDLRGEDRADYLEAHRANWGKRVLCALNRDGDCVVYDARPLVCRNAHALDTSARCHGGNQGWVPATRLTFAPVDEFLGSAAYLLRATHNAGGARPNRRESLCVLVDQLLGPESE
jgi:hypothetical protein